MELSIIHTIIVVFIDIIALWLGLWVLLANVKKKTNLTFFLITILIILWIDFTYLSNSTREITHALIYVRLVFGSIALFLSSAYLFTLYFLSEERKLSFIDKLILSTGIVFFILSIFSNLIIQDVEFKEWGTDFSAGSIGKLFYVFIFILTILIINQLFHKYLRSSYKEKAKIRYLFIGSGIFAFMNLFFNIVLPIHTTTHRFYYLGNYSAIFFLAFVSYSIVKHRLFDIRVAVGRIISASLSIVTVILTALLIGIVNNALKTPLPFTVIVPFIAILSVLLFQLSKFYSKITAKYLYPTFYNSEIAISALEKRLTQALDLKTLVSLVSDTLCSIFELDRIAILTKELGKDNYQIQEANDFEKNKLLLLVSDQYLISLLKKRKAPVGKEELNSIIEKVKDKELKQKFSFLKEKIIKTKIALLLPVLFKNELIAIIILGEKITGEPFTVEDLELLRNISFQASIALKNASLFSEINRRKEELERFYRLTVGRELKMTELKRKIQKLEEKLREKEIELNQDKKQ